MEYFHDYDYIYLRWIGFQSDEEIHSSGERILLKFKNHKCKKILNDNRDVRGPWNTASTWTSEYWFPQMVNAGLQKFAWIFPENIFAETSAKAAMPESLTIRKFKDFENAHNWLIK
ncbi:hypothetical protein OO013_06665 [Mangrovivirga sp. M17]|uniref:STAS/SEC14 domain-containing protein n=1 Tax=Mangrovivirga halotolerans TaxID=2993936 RepID=A0ABT3RP27_9BACT|nr:hypothetical protein [Mangrovivirga halotolerans]MCX2743539.1 hypothetical protein [Mangrovivirga halotolerans]